MTLQRLDNVLIVVEDLDAVIPFFVELGMELQGRQPVNGAWVERVIGLDDVRQTIAMLRTPDGRCGVELVQFESPAAIKPTPEIPPTNTLGLRRIMFAVDDLEDVVARLRSRGAELVGEIVDYEGMIRLCYVRGPEQLVVGLSQELG